LSGANPDIPDEHVADGYRLAAFFNSDGGWLDVGVTRREDYGPTPGRRHIDGGFFWAEMNRDLAAGGGRTRDADALVALQDHAIAEPRVQFSRGREAGPKA
jgi:hypothetical protein